MCFDSKEEFMTKRMKYIFIKRVLICAIIVSLGGSFAFAAEVPADVAGSAHSEAITALVEAGVITGRDDGLFHPFANLTRAEACIIIVRAINPPDAAIMGTPSQTVPGSGFSDMTAGGGFNWADGFVGYAVRNGIVNGFPDGTFRPGNQVTVNEMLTMILRATGITDNEIGENWPEDFVARAIEEGITNGLPEELPELATRETAARMAFNKLTELRQEEEPEAEEEPDLGAYVQWTRESLRFLEGRFNDNMTMFAGVRISEDVKVYTYGSRENFARNMQLPNRERDYTRDTIHKYKRTDTPAFYIREDGEITLMILPMDVGFTGRIYGVINGVADAVDSNGDSVFNISTLAAAQQVSWRSRDRELRMPENHFAGGIYEFLSEDGMITGIYTARDMGRNVNFLELAGDGSWNMVRSFSGGVITLNDGTALNVAPNAVVYALGRDGSSYTVGRINSIRAGSQIRAFTISEGVATHITLRLR